MKKLFFTICVLLVAHCACAQKPKGSFSLIPRAGVCIANFSQNKMYFTSGNGNTDYINSKYNVRFAGGVDLEYQALSTTSVSVGAFYAQQGCRFGDFSSSNAQGKLEAGIDQFREKFDYVQIPLMVNQYVFGGLAVKVGVQFGFLVNAHISYNETEILVNKDGAYESGETTKYNNDVKNIYEKFDCSIPIGLSYEYMNVILDARYNIGLCRLYKDSSLPKEKNKFITFTVGYRL